MNASLASSVQGNRLPLGLTCVVAFVRTSGFAGLQPGLHPLHPEREDPPVAGPGRTSRPSRHPTSSAASCPWASTLVVAFIPTPWSPSLLFTAPDNHRPAGAKEPSGLPPDHAGQAPPARPRPAHDSGTSATPTRVDRRRRGRVPACWNSPSRRPHRASARKSPPRCLRRSCLLARRTPRDFPCRAVAPSMEWYAAAGHRGPQRIRFGEKLIAPDPRRTRCSEWWGKPRPGRASSGLRPSPGGQRGPPMTRRRRERSQRSPGRTDGGDTPSGRRVGGRDERRARTAERPSTSSPTRCRLSWSRCWRGSPHRGARQACGAPRRHGAPRRVRRSGRGARRRDSRSPARRPNCGSVSRSTRCRSTRRRRSWRSCARCFATCGTSRSTRTTSSRWHGRWPPSSRHASVRGGRDGRAGCRAPDRVARGRALRPPRLSPVRRRGTARPGRARGLGSRGAASRGGRPSRLRRGRPRPERGGDIWCSPGRARRARVFRPVHPSVLAVRITRPGGTRGT